MLISSIRDSTVDNTTICDTALKVINRMVDKGTLVKTGRARATRYRASERARPGDSAIG